jgi:hypothetical protein
MAKQQTKHEAEECVWPRLKDGRQPVRSGEGRASGGNSVPEDAELHDQPKAGESGQIGEQKRVLANSPGRVNEDVSTKE